MTTPVIGASLGKEQPLDEVAVARGAVEAAQERLKGAVERARVAGHTWLEIGAVMGTTRQAAFQRFGRPIDPRTGEPMATAVLADAVERTAEIVAAFSEARWERVGRDFDAIMAEKVSAAQLAGVWAQVIGTVGRYEAMGEAIVHQAGDLTVTEVPLRFEAGDCRLTVSFRADGTVAGLFIVPVQ